jgi:Cu2+-exporting ATPase
MSDQMYTKDSLVCYHCASQILPSDLVKTELGGQQRTFCCPGCMAIAQTIHGEGLEVFTLDAHSLAISQLPI